MQNTHKKIEVILAQILRQAMLLQLLAIPHPVTSALKDSRGVQERLTKRHVNIQHIMNTGTPPETKKIPEVLNFVSEYLCARQPRVGLAIPKTTPQIRATNLSYKISERMVERTGKTESRFLHFLKVNLQQQLLKL
jgi:hypothetical protein